MYERSPTFATFAIVSLLLTFSLTPTEASGPEVTVVLRGSLQETSEGSSRWVDLPEGQEVAPGTLIRFTVDLTNTGDQEARQPVATGPIPAGTSFMEGTADSGPELTAEYSIDGGTTFSEQPMITVREPDGTTSQVPAPPEQFTTIRWTWDPPLLPGARTSVSYQVFVR